MCDREMLSTTTKRSNWMREECFDPWGQDKDGHMGDGDAGMHDTSDPSSPCKVVVRCRKAQSPWERVVEAAVGTPVHVDVVLAQEGSAGARFCYSSYMNHKFEMIMMDKELIHDENINNISLDVTKEELEKCTQFMSCLSGKAAYSYFDAMVLMPMAPKVSVVKAETLIQWDVKIHMSLHPSCSWFCKHMDSRTQIQIRLLPARRCFRPSST